MSIVFVVDRRSLYQGHVQRELKTVASPRGSFGSFVHVMRIRIDVRSKKEKNVFLLLKLSMHAIVETGAKCGES